MLENKVREVDFFVGCSFACGEIELSVAQLKTWSDSLTVGNKIRSAVQQKLAAEEVSKIAGQVRALADVLVRMSAKHDQRSSQEQLASAIEAGRAT